MTVDDDSRHRVQATLLSGDDVDSFEWSISIQIELICRVSTALHKVMYKRSNYLNKKSIFSV